MTGPTGSSADDQTLVDEDDRPKIRVLIVEDQPLLVGLLTSAIGEEPDMEVVGAAGSVAEAVDQALRLEPDVTLMDYHLPDGDGAEATRRIKKELPDHDVIMLTARDNRHVVANAIEAGCAGFLTKTEQVDLVIEAVRSAAAGQALFSPRILAEAVEHLRRPRSTIGSDLTGRELEVLRLLAQGLSTDDLVEQLIVSPHTARNHVRNILTKLYAHSKLEAVAIAVREGIISIDDFGRAS